MENRFVVESTRLVPSNHGRVVWLTKLVTSELTKVVDMNVQNWWALTKVVEVTKVDATRHVLVPADRFGISLVGKGVLCADGASQRYRVSVDGQNAFRLKLYEEKRDNGHQQPTCDAHNLLELSIAFATLLPSRCELQ